MIARRAWRSVFLGTWAIAAGAGLAAQDGSVRVTATLANVRAEASETSSVLTQVKSGTMLTLLAVEGDWFHVRLPPDPRLGGARVDAYISKKVAKVEAAEDSPAGRGALAPGRGAVPAAAAATPPVASVTTATRDGMSVALVAGDATSWMPPGTVRVIQVPQAPEKVDPVAKLAASLTSTAAAPASAGGATPVTYVWVVDAPAAAKTIDARRPSFVVQFKDVPGVGPDDLIPVILKLSPAASDARVIGALRGRADQAVRNDADWDVFKDLKQDVIRSDTQAMARGTVRIQPSADLPPGEYAVVLRLLNPRRKLSGATLLHNEGEGRAFGIVWDFAIK